MRTASTIARYLAGVIFLVFGLNGFLHFIPLPPPGGIAGQFMGALYASHYLWVIFAFQLVAGVLLLINRLRAVRGGRAGAGDRQHSFFPRFDGPERASAGPCRDGIVGSDLRRRMAGVCRTIPGPPAGARLMNQGSRSAV
jgi:hypothetical protein